MSVVDSSNNDRAELDSLFSAYLDSPAPHASTASLIGHLPPTVHLDQDDNASSPSVDQQQSSTDSDSINSPSLDLFNPWEESSPSITTTGTPSVTSTFNDSSMSSARSNTTKRKATQQSVTQAEPLPETSEDDQEDETTESEHDAKRRHYNRASDKGLNPKQARRRQQNRAAAATSRMKRKAYVGTLEAQIADLLDKQKAMESDLNRLQTENATLRMSAMRGEVKMESNVMSGKKKVELSRDSFPSEVKAQQVTVAPVSSTEDAHLGYVAATGLPLVCRTRPVSVQSHCAISKTLQEQVAVAATFMACLVSLFTSPSPHHRHASPRRSRHQQHMPTIHSETSLPMSHRSTTSVHSSRISTEPPQQRHTRHRHRSCRSQSRHSLPSNLFTAFERFEIVA